MAVSSARRAECDWARQARRAPPEAMSWAHLSPGTFQPLDTAVATDPLISANYGLHDLGRKVENKTRMQQELGLTVDPNRMLAVMISRLTNQKGADLVLQALPKMRELGIQLALLGSGDAHLQDAFRKAAEKAPDQVAVCIGYDERLTHRLIGEEILGSYRLQPLQTY